MAKKLKKTVKRLVKKVFGKRKVTKNKSGYNKRVDASTRKRTKEKTKDKDGYKLKVVTTKKKGKYSQKVVTKGGGKKRTVVRKKGKKIGIPRKKPQMLKPLKPSPRFKPMQPSKPTPTQERLGKLVPTLKKKSKKVDWKRMYLDLKKKK